jgi:hypothetical protein
MSGETKLEVALRRHGRWDIRPPDDREPRWTAFPEYVPGAMGKGETLLDAVLDACSQAKEMGR